MNTNLFLCIILLSTLGALKSTFSPLMAQTHRVPVSLSVCNPFATTPYDSLTSTSLNFGVLSTTEHIDGVALNLIASTNKGSIHGAQISGLGSASQRNLYGLQIGSLYSVTGGSMKGVQLSLIQNTVLRKAQGWQVAGFSNFVVGQGRGMQLAGFTNIAGSYRGMQLTAGVNIASTSTAKTAQIAILANICADTLKGVQIGFNNYAGSVKGVQLGLINVCIGEIKGVQIGLINRSEDTTTVKIGMINLNPKTRISAMMYTGDACKSNFAVRFTNYSIYTILGIGTHYRDLDAHFSGAFFYRAGYEWTLLREHLFLSADLGYAHIENFTEDKETPNRMYSLQSRLNLEYRPRKILGIFLSGGFAHTRHYNSNAIYENKAIVELGISLLKPQK